MSSIITIMKKELKRFFTDKRMLTGLILPGVLLFIIYSLMGNIVADVSTTSDDYEYKIYTVNQSASFEQNLDALGYKYDITKTDDIEGTKDLIKDKEIDLLMVFSENFDEESPTEKQSVDIFYNSTDTESMNLYTAVYGIYNAQATAGTERFLVNLGGINYDMATSQDLSIMLITMIFPMVLHILLASSCIAIASESIAGEKERGTIATLLVTPTKRSYIAIGKILALSITSIFASIISFAGLLGSLPSLLSGVDVDLGMYGVSTYLPLFLTMTFTVVLFVVLMSLFSCLAKSAKEAGALVTPAMIIVMVAGLSSVISGGKVASAWYLYLIPIYNSVQTVGAILSLQFNPINFVLTILSTTVFIGLGVFLLTRLFNNEKVMFNA